MHETSWGESAAALSQFLIGGATLQETLTRVAELAVEAAPLAEFAGLTMVVEGRQRTAVFTDAESPEIDEAQYDADDGPCVDAFRHGRVNVIRSIDDEERWPEFCRAAREHGVRSTLSLPLLNASGCVGALNLYSRTPDAFPEAAVAAAEPFATQAAALLANSTAYWDAHDLGSRIQEAMYHRAVIEQAKGILMSQQGCGPDEAFELLTAASQRENVKVRDIAQRIVSAASQRQN